MDGRFRRHGRFGFLHDSRRSLGGNFSDRFVQLRFDDGDSKFRHFGLNFARGRGRPSGRMAGSAFETAPKFSVFFGGGAILAIDRNLFKHGRQLHGAVAIARADGQVEEALQNRGVQRCAFQDGFKQVDRFLREAVAGKQIDVGQRLGNIPLCFFLEPRFGGRSGRRFGFLFRNCQLHRLRNFCWRSIDTGFRAQLHKCAARGFVFRGSLQQFLIRFERSFIFALGFQRLG